MCSVHCLHEPKGALRSQKFRNKEHISDIELFSSKIAKNIFRVVRFDSVMLFSFEFPYFLKSSLATYYVACSFVPA